MADVADITRETAVSVPGLPEPPLRQRFEDLARRWERETAFSSSASEIVGHPAYQEIIGLGRSAVPLILAELRRRSNHWFHALSKITGEDPVKPEQQGRLDAMTDAWVR